MSLSFEKDTLTIIGSSVPKDNVIGNDKKFTDAFKSLIKTPDEFERFLEMIHFDLNNQEIDC